MWPFKKNKEENTRNEIPRRIHLQTIADNRNREKLVNLLYKASRNGQYSITAKGHLKNYVERISDYLDQMGYRVMDDGHGNKNIRLDQSPQKDK